MATNGNFTQQEQYKASAEQYPPASSNPDTMASAGAANNNLSKDEVGWYFVEQYYTTLSKSPEKLHLFYGKRSQFVYGLEAEVATVSVGRPTIQERIKRLDFQDCKVRISNVDSQASFDNIVIQVIGETSNKGAEPKKFVQTFVLAQQPSGYFVLNDILRYIDEGSDEETNEVSVAEAASAPPQKTTLPSVTVAEAAEATVQPTKDDAKEESNKSSSSPVAVAAAAAAAEPTKAPDASAKRTAAATNGPSATAASELTQASEPKVAETAVAADASRVASENAKGDIKEAEKPKDTNSTPVVKPTAQVESVPAEPPAPPKPMTWASRAAAAAGPRPVVPLPKTAAPPTQTTQVKLTTTAPAPASAPAPAPAPASASAPAPAPAPASSSTPPVTVPTAQPAPVSAAHAEASSKESTSGWQTAGADSKRQNRPHSMSNNMGDKEGTMGYVKYVTEKVQEADLRSALAAHGELVYFDINRQKNCAFVEYKTLEGYHAALSSNPHVVNGENIIVEPRRPKASAYGGNSYGSGRGKGSGRGRGGFDGMRGGGAGNGRGNYQNRGRGGLGRGRGGLPTVSNT